MITRKSVFGETPEKETVWCYQIKNENGMDLKLIDYGATLISLKLPGKKGRAEEVTLSLDSLEAALGPHPYFGSTVGRVAGRISDAAFTLEGRYFELSKNDGGVHHLHGGERGLARRVWKSQALQETSRAGVTFRYKSPDGEEGYPGELYLMVSFFLNEDNELSIEYRGESDRATPVNLTNHTYWNLSGGKDMTVEKHEVSIMADKVLSMDGLVPNGEVVRVQGTPFDFRKARALKKPLRQSGGVDHVFVLDNEVKTFKKVAELRHPGSGRRMEVHSTEPGLILYTGNFLDTVLLGDKQYLKHQALCLEACGFPNAVNVPSFPSVILRPGKEYLQRTDYRFFFK